MTNGVIISSSNVSSSCEQQNITNVSCF
jgi:hypothetical protein